MSRREWRLSTFFAALIALKAAEAAFGLESWQLSNVSMFSPRQAPEIVPFRSRLVGTRGSGWFDLAPADFRLSEDELENRLRPSAELADGCSRLVVAYNRQAKETWLRLRDAVVVVQPIPRPGLPNGQVDQIVRCPLPDAGRADDRAREGP